MDRDHIGLIASDMDYTLLDENGRLPEGFGRLVRLLEEEGIYFAAASGRPWYSPFGKSRAGARPRLNVKRSFIFRKGLCVWSGTTSA